jgi:hypothetical protein
MMKKALFILLSALFVAALLPLGITKAGFQEGSLNIQTRLEVSLDNSTWINYSAESNSGGTVLTVDPGDTVYFRLKTWADQPADNVDFTATFTNQQYLANASMFSVDGGDQGDLDGDTTRGYSMTGGGYNAATGTATFTLNGVRVSSVSSNFQSGGITTQIAPSTPDGTIINATVQITNAVPVWTWNNKLLQKAYADANGTTVVRLAISNPTINNQAATGTTAATTLPETGSEERDNRFIGFTMLVALGAILAAAIIKRQRTDR